MSSDSNNSHCTSISSSSSSPDQNPTCISLKPPHCSSDSSSQAIARRRSTSSRQLSFRDFSLLHQIGSGDIGRVFLCRLRCRSGKEDEEENDDDSGGETLYAMKVVDNEVLALKKKVQRGETERRIMRMLDHPFLPTLYAEFEASRFSCVVMEYCPGGDLHSLRHKQPHKRFPISSARFYAAEVLVALEYLHMLGIVYRDLKPENVLVRSDGHIMLTDFDLSLCSESITALESSSDFSFDSSSSPMVAQTTSAPRLRLFSCLSSIGLFRSKKVQTLSNNWSFMAEPVTARSHSFVGTHEYVAPEVASGNPHGSTVDWWALGIFIYEMIYGCTPFAGATNEATLRNTVKKPLTFPTHGPINGSEAHAQGLISKLLNKDPNKRLGSERGATDVKTHPFFKGLNFALIRTMTPPRVPIMKRYKTTLLDHQREEQQGQCTTLFDFSEY